MFCGVQNWIHQDRVPMQWTVLGLATFGFKNEEFMVFFPDGQPQNALITVENLI
jgi:hypothetical protein